ncbi:MAG: Fe-S cluster assembly ATPase SufC [Candidatus Woesearchaeota archaeon]|jgi:Fe-S cluster assembly ATP-binding protein|nr:Fe-S cluster assembly ATPase SufC [Candidatus Woesearchaeota archaeon]MDP7324303.1 Fe-S cluster assembly ATPase SufC [Candidatus Woesearchaeota archaeon]MDP7457798.1 Fe-S cluster assembly ATPase SufC [Candidatus Woesearchaeota archaeon]
MAVLEIKDLHVKVEEKEILKGLTMSIELGKINALMGPNGSGKSTLAHVLMGNPKFEVSSGKILYNGKDITSLSTDERAKKGLFLSFQYPHEVSGITISNFLRTAINAGREKDDKIKVMDFKKLLDEKMDSLKMDKSMARRYLNEGFSGGEKKRAEILQMVVLDPKLAILDETDSGLDIDALKAVAEGVNAFMTPEKCILIITHYKRILEFIKPDKLFILIDGKIALEGGGELVDQLEEKGYGWIQEDG